MTGSDPVHKLFIKSIRQITESRDSLLYCCIVQGCKIFRSVSWNWMGDRSFGNNSVGNNGSFYRVAYGLDSASFRCWVLFVRLELHAMGILCSRVSRIQWVALWQVSVQAAFWVTLLGWLIDSRRHSLRLISSDRNIYRNVCGQTGRILWDSRKIGSRKSSRKAKIYQVELG